MGVEKRAAPAKREAGTSAERATAREAGKFLKSEKSSALENKFYTVAEGENFRERELRSAEKFLKSGTIGKELCTRK